MEQWEYLTRFVEARAAKKETRNYIRENFNKKPKPYSPESMIPELNKLGAEGWEIIHMEPVPRVGGKEDVKHDPNSWSNVYFIVCKRRKPDSFVPVVAVRPPASATPPAPPAPPAPATPADE